MVVKKWWWITMLEFNTSTFFLFSARMCQENLTELWNLFSRSRGACNTYMWHKALCPILFTKDVSTLGLTFEGKVGNSRTAWWFQPPVWTNVSQNALDFSQLWVKIRNIQVLPRCFWNLVKLQYFILEHPESKREITIESTLKFVLSCSSACSKKSES